VSRHVPDGRRALVRSLRAVSSPFKHLSPTLSTGLALLLTVSLAEAQPMGCLFANADGSAEAVNCSDDPRKLKSDPTIAKAIRAMGLEGQPIRFEGCDQASFATIPASGARELGFVIRYPVLREVATSELVAPIVHELSHVVQVRQAGSLAKLREKLVDSKRIELGADFLAGVVFANYINAANLRYQNSLELVGRYREASFAAHGTTSQRNAAYRLGAYHRVVEPEFPLDLPKMHVDFQENGYAVAVH
jgi:hypothetical protein